MVWNSLPESVISAETLASFKHNLITYLFDISFYHLLTSLMRLISGTLHPLRSHGLQSSPTSNHQLYEGKLLQTDWWRKLVLMRVGRYIKISPTHHHFAWHPKSLWGVSRNQLTSTVNGENPGSWLRWSMHTSWTTPQSYNQALLYLDNNGLSWTVSHRTRSLRCL